MIRRKSRTRKVVAAACAIAALAAATACSSSSSATGGSSAAASGGSSSAAPANGTIVVYSAIGYDQAVVDAFQKKTGAKVKLVQDSTGPLLTKISAEKNNPQWTMFWADGDTAFSVVAQQGLSQPYQAKATLTSLGNSLVPANHMWQPAGATLVMAAMCNTAKVPTQPMNWSDLTDPKYKNLIGMNDPSQSGPTYPFVAGMMSQLGGENQGKAYFTKLKANGLHVFPTNGDTIHAVETGQVGCGLIQSSAAVNEQSKQKGKMNLVISYPSKSTILPSAMAISKAVSGPALATAQKFEDFVLSPEGQKAALSGTSGDSLFWPIVSGVSPNRELPVFPTSSAQHIDPAAWGSKQSEIVTWFTQNIK